MQGDTVVNEHDIARRERDILDAISACLLESIHRHLSRAFLVYRVSRSMAEANPLRITNPEQEPRLIQCEFVTENFYHSLFERALGANHVIGLTQLLHQMWRHVIKNGRKRHHCGWHTLRIP